MELEPSTAYQTVFNALPGASALILPDSPVFTVVGSTDEFAAFGGAPKEKLIGDSLFRYFPDNPDAPNVSNDIRKSLAICIATKRKNELEIQRYDIANPDGTFREMYWKVIHTPVLNAQGDLAFIIHTAVDVTDRVLANRKDEKIKSLEIAENLFEQSAIAIHIFKGPDLIIELANEPTLRMWDRDASVIGMPLRKAIPELSLEYFEIIQNVRLSGKTYHAHEAPVMLHRQGSESMGYFNFVLQPYYEKDKTVPAGVIAMVTEVTEIYNDRKALAEKERSLNLAVEIGDLGIFNIDLKTNTVSYSPQVMEWFGVTRLNLPLEQLLRRVHPEDFNLIYDTLTRLSKGQRARRHDITFRVPHPRTGEMQYLRSIGQIQVEDGQKVTLSGIIQDISPIVETQFALRQSAQRLKSLIDSAPFPIGVYTGREMRIEMVNQAILDVWGRDSSVVGKRYAEVLHELDGTGIYDQLDRVYTTGKSFHAHNTKVELLADGKLETFYFNYSFTPLFDAMGKVYGVMNTAADVTDLAMAQKALKESERNFRTMILQAPVAMCLMQGPEHIVEVANDSMIKLWGKERTEVIDKPIFEALPDAREQGLEQLLSHVYRTGETITANEHAVQLIRFGKQETVYQNFVYEPYRDGDGIIHGILAISVDVTEQVLARFKIEEMVAERTRELELSNNSLQKSNAELEQFAYIASHDLQEPLRKISMFTGLLQKVLGENTEVQGYMNSISNSVNRMTNLIRDILSYSQLSQKHESYERTDLSQIFTESVADFDVIIEEKKAVITHSGLPVIEAIPLQMTQLFHNLISNALKYSRPEVAPRISIEAVRLKTSEAVALGFMNRTLGPYYRITFRDNGIGFSQLYADKIFNIFQRLHAKGKYEGTGIGLAMCKKIAENHHGLIFAQSTEGKGTSFTVILPTIQEYHGN